MTQRRFSFHLKAFVNNGGNILSSILKPKRKRHIRHFEKEALHHAHFRFFGGYDGARLATAEVEGFHNGVIKRLPATVTYSMDSERLFFVPLSLFLLQRVKLHFSLLFLPVFGRS